MPNCWVVICNNIEKVFSFGTQQVILSGRDSAILPSQVANHSAGFGSPCPLAELAIKQNGIPVSGTLDFLNVPVTHTELSDFFLTDFCLPWRFKNQDSRVSDYITRKQIKYSKK